MAKVRLVFEFEEDRDAWRYYDEWVDKVDEEYVNGVRLNTINLYCDKLIKGIESDEEE